MVFVTRSIMDMVLIACRLFEKPECDIVKPGCTLPRKAHSEHFERWKLRQPSLTPIPSPEHAGLPAILDFLWDMVEILDRQNPAFGDSVDLR